MYLKSDVSLLACFFEKIVAVSIDEFDNNPLNCVGLPGYTWQCGLKYTDNKSETLQDRDMIFLVENKIRGGIISILGNTYVASNDNKKVLYIDANNLYGHSLSQPLPFDEIKIDKNVKIEKVLNTNDNSDIGYFIEVDLSYADNLKQKTKHFPFCPEYKKINPDDFSDYIKKN